MRLSEHFPMINSRLKTFEGILKSLLLCRGCFYKNIAQEIESKILLDSKIKSVSRFLQGSFIPDASFHAFIKTFIPSHKVQISVDRTIWEHGKEIRNILVLAISYDHITIPVLFKTIPYKGTCTGDDQIDIIQQYIALYGRETIGIVTADREFENQKFIRFLHTSGICFAIRARKISRVLNDRGERVRLEKLEGVKKRHFKTLFYDMGVKLDHKTINKEEYLSVISSLNCPDGFESYKKRWDIERCFKGCKTSGFNMEQTHVKSTERFINFIKCIFIAFAIAMKIGNIGNQLKPIKIKKTLKAKSKSTLTYGLEIIKNTYYTQRKDMFRIINKAFDQIKLTLDIFVR